MNKELLEKKLMCVNKLYFQGFSAKEAIEAIKNIDREEKEVEQSDIDRQINQGP